MLAARDQENLVHAHQTVAAAKSLNQAGRQLQPKTPGNRISKTPFRVPLNDENNPLAFGTGKQTMRGTRHGNENILKPAKDGVRNKQPLATPFGPRNRAPLGVKTTNAKAKAIQTPTPLSENAKPVKTGKRSSTVRKLKQAAPAPPVVQLEHNEKIEEDEERDIEYMPPKPEPLPDTPDDIEYDTSFPQFKGLNYARGWETLYIDNEVGADGLTKKQREEKKASEEFDKHVEEVLQKQLDSMELLGINVRESPDEPCTEEIAQINLRETREEKTKRTVAERSVSTVKSRSAARALALQPRTTVQPKPKTAVESKAKFASALRSQKKTPPPSNPSSMRHTAAVVNSRTTIGYSKGRSIASTLKNQPAKEKSSSESILSPQKCIELYGEPPFGTEMWRRCKATGCFDSEPDDTQEILETEAVLPPYEEDEEAANFQLIL